MTTLYWALEYTKVLLAYIFVFGIWPLVVFDKKIKKKSLTFKFAFCVVVMPVVVSSIVLGLGLFHLLYRWIVVTIFYGLFIYKLYKYMNGRYDYAKSFKRMVTGTYGIKNFFRKILLNICGMIKSLFASVSMMFAGHVIEYISLGIIIIFGVMYFSYGGFRDYTYGCGDLYVHAAWTTALVDGQIFSAGVYPEGMHCVIYLFYALFGIRVFNCIMFLGAIQTLTFLLSVYVFFKEIFRYKYSPHIALTLFLILELEVPNQIVSMARFQWSLPQEFALHTPFLCAAFLVRYFRSGEEIVISKDIAGIKNKIIAYFRAIFQNDDLLVFALSVATSLIVHFYPTIMAVFMCVSFIVVFIRKLFNPRHFAVLAIMSILAVFIAIVPMVGALASGIPFQGSIGWAMSLMNGDDEESDDITGEDSEEIETEIKQQKTPYWQTIKTNGYDVLYYQKRGGVLANWTLGSLIVFIICRVIITIKKHKNKYDEIDATIYDQYFSLIIALNLYMVMFCAGAFNIPVLIESYRLCSSINILALGVCVIPLDALISSINSISEKVQDIIGAVLILGLYFTVRYLGLFHGYLYYEFTRYNGAVEVTESIIKEMPKDSYTIVSPVDELYQLINHGFHEESVTFANKCVMDEYTLPTEYVFLFVEKKPLKRSQYNFFTGPSWLAEEKSKPLFLGTASEGDDYINATVSPELARPPFKYLQSSLQAYSDYMSRIVLESRINEWCREFGDLYPDEMHTYYEDDEFVCYYFKQNPSCLYQLAFQSAYTENNAKGIWD